MKRNLLVAAFLFTAGFASAQVATEVKALTKVFAVADGASMIVTRKSDGAGGSWSVEPLSRPTWDPAKVANASTRRPPPFDGCDAIAVADPPNVACRTWLKEGFLGALAACGYAREP